MRKFCAGMSDGSFINIEADRMELAETTLTVWRGDKLVAWIDTGCLLYGRLTDDKQTGE